MHLTGLNHANLDEKPRTVSRISKDGQGCDNASNIY